MKTIKPILFAAAALSLFLVLGGCVSTGYQVGYGSSGYYGGARYYSNPGYYYDNSWDYDRSYRSGVNRHYDRSRVDRSQVKSQAQRAKSRVQSGGGRAGGRRR
jgi:hypothetical protein